jgi:molecular chaperone DnaK (HSP70)
MPARYLIGIDLGTTNSALAYVDLKATTAGSRPQLQPFGVTQLVAAGEVAPRNLLPSFVYLPGPHDLPAAATALPWNAKARDVVGEFARDHGAKVPGRLVSSAKSWLCHPGVDRSAALLPWGAPPDVTKISPLEASARILGHMVAAWNHVHGKNPADHLQNLPVVLTVPASFDDVARSMTVEAAQQAGLNHVVLLEEPQAAFYCWQHLAEAVELRRLSAGMTCLVVDVGGGTTDFSLIGAVEEEGELRFVRQAVGDHLLLGGDNMDLALARLVEAKIPAGKLDAGQFAALVQACRRAKEVLLGPQPPESAPVTVVGRGRSVVGGTVSVPLTLADVQKVILDGFFPAVQPGDAPTRGARLGLHEMGLPYVQDPAITRHLAAFLQRHLPVGQLPDAILFNGGVFQPQSLRDALLNDIRPWYAAAHRSEPQILVTPSLDLAVAFGAAAYGWLRHTGGRIIGGGTARAYYVEVGGAAADDAITALCVVPRHLEENEEIKLTQPELELALGEPVVFPMYTSTARDDAAGSVISVKPTQLRRIPPLQSVLRAGKRSAGEKKLVPVTLAARATAIGTLELYCVAKDGGHRWRLEFNVRDAVAEDDDDVAPETTMPPTETLPDALVEPAEYLIRGTFASDTPPPNELTNALEQALDSNRDDWPTGLCRRLWDTVAGLANQRRRSPSHLSRWYNLAGFVLRPGFGDPLDRFRVESLWKLLHAPKPGGTAQAEPTGADAWIMWRRVAGGLSSSFQKTLYDRLRGALLPNKSKGFVKPGTNELAEMWRAAASLERLDANIKTMLGNSLLPLIRKKPVPPYAFWSLARIGARTLFHGPLNTIVHPDVVTPWLESVLTFEASHESERMGWAFCLSQLARRTGQRALDVDESIRARVIHVLRAHDLPREWLRAVEENTSRSSGESARVFGDSLPVGLRLRVGN